MSLLLRNIFGMKCHGLSMSLINRTSTYAHNHVRITCTSLIATRYLQTENKNTDKKVPISLKYNEDHSTRMTNKDRIKRGFKEYGPTMIVVHVVSGLMSLSIIYTMLYYGIDISRFIMFDWISTTQTKIAAGTGTFVVAYALHKGIAPLRITFTLFMTPLVVRVLRSRGFIRKP